MAVDLEIKELYLSRENLIDFFSDFFLSKEKFLIWISFNFFNFNFKNILKI